MKSYEKKFFNKFGFTLAEVLITIVIIGVVTAMALPLLINNIKDQHYKKARYKVLLSIGEAGRIIALEGNMNSASNAEDFVKNYLSKKLEIIKMCDANNLQNCGWADEITILGKGVNAKGNSKMSPPRTLNNMIVYTYNGSSTNEVRYKPNYGFVSSNGYSAILTYNPKCVADNNEETHFGADFVCMNVIYDINGKAKPNEVGKDIGFVSILYPDETNRAVAPAPISADEDSGLNWNDANLACSNKGYMLPNKDILQSLSYNSLLTNLNGLNYWSSSSLDSNSAFYITVGYGDRFKRAYTRTSIVRCVEY